MNQKQMFANSVILFRSLPLNQKRSKFTGCCNKPAFIKLFETCDINIVKTCQSLFSFYLPGVITEKRAKKFEDGLWYRVCVEMQK